jgi:hypothetical protein
MFGNYVFQNQMSLPTWYVSEWIPVPVLFPLWTISHQPEPKLDVQQSRLLVWSVDIAATSWENILVSGAEEELEPIVAEKMRGAQELEPRTR